MKFFKSSCRIQTPSRPVSYTGGWVQIAEQEILKKLLRHLFIVVQLRRTLLLHHSYTMLWCTVHVHSTVYRSQGCQVDPYGAKFQKLINTRTKVCVFNKHTYKVCPVWLVRSNILAKIRSHHPGSCLRNHIFD